MIWILAYAAVAVVVWGTAATWLLRSGPLRDHAVSDDQTARVCAVFVAMLLAATAGAAWPLSATGLVIWRIAVRGRLPRPSQ